MAQKRAGRLPDKRTASVKTASKDIVCMTEEQKRLRDGFLEPETRCDHYVSGETKACWKSMLDMVEEVDRICRKHDIRYFLIAGSLLGAVRHKGMIPWDDDIDIALFRNDYEKLEKILPKELPSHMFMQTLVTDPEYPTSHMKIRDSNTTGIYKWAVDGHLRFNMGIFIDIFALDGVPATKRYEKISGIIATYCGRLIRYRVGRTIGSVYQYLRWLMCWTIWHILGVHLIYRFREWLAFRLKPHAGGECIQCPCDWGYHHRYRYLVDDLQETIDAPFEYLTVKIPKNYVAVLDRTYGDWHKIVKGASLHSELDMNGNIPYKETLVKKYGYSKAELEKI